MLATKTNNREIFEDYVVSKAVLQFAIPTVIGQFITLIYNMADTFYIGRVNNPYMVASVSLILPLYNVCIAIANLCGVGGSSLISRHLGVGKDEEAKRVCAFSFYFAIAISLFFSTIVWINMNFILDFLGASDFTYEYAKEYCMMVVVFGCMPTIINMTLCNILRSVGCTKQAGIGVSLGGVINIVLDPLFMFVILPQGKEVVGAAIATMISNTISCIYELIVIERQKKNIALSLNPSLGVPSKAEIKDILSVGIPSSLTSLLYDLNNMFLVRFASSYGDIQVAALGIVLKVERFPLNIGIGISQGTSPLIGYNYSAKNYKRMNGFQNYAMKLGLSIAFVSIILYEIFANQIINFFIDDSETVAFGASFIKARILATPLMFCCFFTKFYFQGVGKGKRTLFLGIMRWACFGIPAIFILNSLFGLYGIVWAQFVGDFFAASLSLFFLFKFRRSLI